MIVERAKTNYQKEKIRSSIKSLADIAGNKPLILAHDVRNMPGLSGVDGFERCGERALIIAREKDVVLLNREPDLDYMEYLLNAGLGPNSIIYLGETENVENMDKVQIPGTIYSPYYSSESDITRGIKFTGSIRNVIGTYERIVLKYYDKGSFKKICKELNIETPKGETFVKSREPAQSKLKLIRIINKYLETCDQLVIRETQMSGGFLVNFVSEDNKKEIINNIIDSEGTSFLIEKREDVVESPSVIGIIENNQYHQIAWTSQMLDENLAYEGSFIEYQKPMDKKMVEITQKIAGRMIEDGYEGPFGIDFLKTRDGRYMPCECNARVTGAFYPHEVHQRLKEKGQNFDVVVSYTIKLNQNYTFAELTNNAKLKRLFYNGHQRGSIIPFDISSLQNGSFSIIVLANSKKEAMKLIKDAKTILNTVKQP